MATFYWCYPWARVEPHSCSPNLSSGTPPPPQTWQCAHHNHNYDENCDNEHDNDENDGVNHDDETWQSLGREPREDFDRGPGTPAVR